MRNGCSVKDIMITCIRWIFYIAIALFIIGCSILFIKACITVGDKTQQQIDINNSLFGGAAANKCSQVYDRESGVVYLITDNGICVMVNPDGSPKRITE